MFEEITNRRIIGRMPPSRGSDAEWTGYIAAYSQWHCGCTFKELFSAVSAARMMSLRDTTHGDAMGAVSIIIDTINPVTVLKRLREERGISQSELALYSGVPIRSIRAYEQGTVDLCKAQGDTLYSLSRVLGCPVDVLIRG
jgi:DNA-binding transcriptional regulator YiaG